VLLAPGRRLNHAGHEVLAVAATRSAVEELHKVGFRDAMTITRLMEDKQRSSDCAGTCS
jgi:hypothetical protein